MVPRRLLDALVSMRGSSPGAPCPPPRSIRAPSAAGLRPRHANEGERVGIPHCRTGRAPELPLTTLLGSSGTEGGPPLAPGDAAALVADSRAWDKGGNSSSPCSLR